MWRFVSNWNLFSAAPSEQGPPSVSNITARSILVTWFAPDSPNVLILRYELYRNQTRVYSGLTRMHSDTNLTPYTLYLYYVIVFTAGGSARSVDSDKVYRTLASVPQGVQPPQMTNVLSRSVVIMWLPPNQPNGVILRYILSSNNSLGSNPNHYTGILRSVQVTGLSPFTVYNFAVTACTSAGCAQSNVTSQATRSAAPDSQPAPYATALADGKSVLVSWDAPSRPNGVILFYDLYMRLSPFTDPGTTQGVKLNPLQRNYTVSGLRPYTFYEFRVVSYTAQVSGDTSSTWTRLRTLENGKLCRYLVDGMPGLMARFILSLIPCFALIPNFGIIISSVLCFLVWCHALTKFHFPKSTVWRAELQKLSEPGNKVPRKF